MNKYVIYLIDGKEVEIEADDYFINGNQLEFYNRRVDLSHSSEDIAVFNLDKIAGCLKVKGEDGDEKG